MTLEKICNKLQRPINDIIERECRIKVRGFEERLKALNQKQKIEALDNARIKTGDELEAMVRQNFKIYDVVEEWQDLKNFMWGGGLMEVLTPDEKRQYMTFPSENCYLEKYEQQPDFYDKDLPYLSFIIKEMVLLKFKHEMDYLESHYNERKEESKLAITNTCYSYQTISETQNKDKAENPFEAKFNDKQIEILTKCINEEKLFTTPLTTDILIKLFACTLQTPLKSKNNRNLAYLFSKLEDIYITKEWAAVIYNNKLILASKKNAYLNNSDLHEAKSKALDQRSSSFTTNIDNYIEQLQKH